VGLGEHFSELKHSRQSKIQPRGDMGGMECEDFTVTRVLLEKPIRKA
jgi:hypothetical protein